MYQQKYKIKALILLLVFSLHTVVSFACSVGLVDFNHHPAKEAQESHKHDHSHNTNHTHAEGVEHNHGHSHEPVTDAQNHQEEENKDCCSDEVNQLTQLDKTVTKTFQNLFPPSLELVTILYSYFLAPLNDGDTVCKSDPPFVRSWSPTTIQDLRIVIQSFQI